MQNCMHFMATLSMKFFSCACCVIESRSFMPSRSVWHSAITKAPTASEPRCLLVMVQVALASRVKPVPVLQHLCSTPGALS